MPRQATSIQHGTHHHPLGRRGAVAAAALAMLAIANPTTQAQDDILWVGYQNDCMVVIPNNASWFHGDNWLNFLVPGEADTARLGWGIDGNNPGWPNYIHFGDFCINVFACPNPIFLPAADAEVGTVFIHDDDWVFDLGPGAASGGGSCSNAPTESGTLTIGDFLLVGGEDVNGNAGTAGLTILNGPVFVGRRDTLLPIVRIGATQTASGQLTIKGSEAHLDVDGQILIGQQANGTGALRLESGGQVLVSGDQPNQGGLCVVATAFGSSGSLVVDGAGSLWSSTAQIQVGGNGAGVLTVSNGGVVVTRRDTSPTNSSGIVGTQLGSTGVATVTGAGSHWEQDGSLTVGFHGTGALTIENGGRITSAVGHIGRFDSGQGSVTVDGTASRWDIEGPLYIGGNEDQPSNGEGELFITSGGGVTSEAAFIGHDGGAGAVTVLGANSWWDAGSQATVGATGAGLLSIAEGATVLCGSLHIGPTGAASGDGTIDGNIINDGAVEPAEEIVIAGSYTQSANAILRTLIYADGAGRLTVHETAEFDGTLEITLAPDYQPGPGDEFVVVSHGGSSGVFQSVLGEGFSPRYTAAAMTVIYCPPDWNGDGVVDSTDLLLFLSDWAAGDADYNGDGVTDSTDLLLFLADWSQGC